MTEVRDDLRFAARLLRKSPGFTVVAVLTLALAIGANTAIFSVVNGVLLRPLPFPESERLFWVSRRDVATNVWSPLSVPQYAFLRQQEQLFSELAAYPLFTGGFNLNEGAVPERVQGARVTRSFFEVFGLRPALGRGFLPEEDLPGGPQVVVLSHELWQRRFGGRREVLGQSVTLNGESHTVVGVAPPGFRYPETAQLWTPLRLDLVAAENSHYLVVVVRMKPGISLERVDALVREQGEQLRASQPDLLRPQTVFQVHALREAIARQTGPALLVLLGAVVLLLLIACVNLANLQLARATGRERELALRTALGATPGRIARQLLTESVLLSGAGGVLGLLLAVVALPGLLALSPDRLPLQEEIRIDGAVLAFTLGVSMLAGLFFGVLPAWQASRMEPRGSLQVSAMRATLGVKGSRTRQALVVGQMALAVILLIGAFLMVKSFSRLRGVDPGFDPTGVLTMKLSVPEVRYRRLEDFQRFVQRVVERGQAVPGVEAVGFTLTLPFEDGPGTDFALHGASRDGERSGTGFALYRAVTGGYFRALKLTPVRGRLLDDLDRHGSRPVAVINEAAARRYWPGKDPIGQFVTLASSLPLMMDPVPREVIGVVGDVRERGLHEETPVVIYLPLTQISETFHARYMTLIPLSLLVRGSGEPGALAAAVQREVQTVDPQQPVSDAVSMETLVTRSMGPRRFSTLLMGLMAGLALVLATLGTYGVLSYLVNQRTQELAVRLALGATRSQVVWRVMRRGLFTVGAGLVLGVAGAFGLTRLLSHLLVQVSALDPVAFIAAPGVLLAVALVATWLPAMRASRVDPMVALREE
ncbi:ABC transporter permease [Hyalangium rubrum]|uniref:ABC transporter permease n=1 Tax=Hyalangium rubrum TaxID=3103134 RepID=A0ABU5GWN1_9BACT|nr:ABC transporter permease [Hyalangium sp. s54d21]MDY7225600.1 ABC transporter permease [Hyalangium sp. s54d21]